MGSMQWERQPSMQREDEADHGNGPGTNSSESAVNHLSKSVVRDTEGAAKQKPHATFCGNRGWATAPGDPVDWHTTIGALQARAGSDMLVRQFKAYLSEVGERGLPDYEVVLLAEFEKPADTGGKKRGGRPSVAYQKVIVRRRTTPFELADKKSSKGKGLFPAKTKARKPPAQAESPQLEYMNSKTMEDDAMSR
jgi:hypothetical protein